jgi:hypothetical protein
LAHTGIRAFQPMNHQFLIRVCGDVRELRTKLILPLRDLMPLDPPSPLQRNKHSAKQMSGTSAASLRPSKPSPPPHGPRRLVPSLTTPLASLALALFLLSAAAVLLYSQTAIWSYGSVGDAPPLLSPTVELIDGARHLGAPRGGAGEGGPLHRPRLQLPPGELLAAVPAVLGVLRPAGGRRHHGPRSGEAVRGAGPGERQRVLVAGE